MQDYDRQFPSPTTPGTREAEHHFAFRVALTAHADYHGAQHKAERESRRAFDAWELGESAWTDYCEDHGLDPEDEADMRRAFDVARWRRWFKQSDRREAMDLWTEALAGHVLYADPDKGYYNPVAAAKYVNPVNLIDIRSDNRALVRWASGVEMQSNDGVQITADQVVNPEQRDRCKHAELLARSNGLERLARDTGREQPVLVTITLPSEWHPTTTRNPWTGERCPRRLNYKHNGATASEAYGHLMRCLTAARKKLHRRNVFPFWTRAVQPHLDGTPHAHIIGWVRDDDEVDQLNTILREQFDPDGSNPHTVRIDVLEGGAEAATKYASRALAYLSRGIAAERCPDGIDAADEAERISAWAKANRIHRYATSSSHATLWQFCRRSDVEIDGIGAFAQERARAGDYAGFVEGIQFAGLTIEYEVKKTRYGDERKVPCGIVDKHGRLFVPTRTWWCEVVDAPNTKKREGDSLIDLSLRKPVPFPVVEQGLWWKQAANADNTSVSESAEVRGQPAGRTSTELSATVMLKYQVEDACACEGPNVDADSPALTPPDPPLKRGSEPPELPPPPEDTPSEALVQALHAVETDPNVMALRERFGIELLTDSIKPVRDGAG